MFFIRMDNVVISSNSFGSFIAEDAGVSMFWNQGNSKLFMKTAYPNEVLTSLNRELERAELHGSTTVRVDTVIEKIEQTHRPPTQ